MHPGGRAGEHLAISFERTLRIPNDGRKYPLPPGLGLFPIRVVGGDFVKAFYRRPFRMNGSESPEGGGGVMSGAQLNGERGRYYRLAPTSSRSHPARRTRCPLAPPSHR